MLALVAVGAYALGLRRWRLRGPIAAAWALALLVVTVSPTSAIATTFPNGWRGLVVVGGILLCVSAYLSFRNWLKQNAAAQHGSPGLVNASHPTVVAKDHEAPLTDPELDRYARHIVLRELGGAGQRKLKAARVLVVGAGGLGAPVCLYLAGAGVGRITIADDDTVSLSNLQRQIMFRMDDVGTPKVTAATAAMSMLNDQIDVLPLPRRITADDASLIRDFDLVIDGSDSFASRAAVNTACVSAGVPLLAGAITQWEGQLSLYDPAHGTPCLACIFPDAPAPGLAPACAEAGVVGPLPGVVGSLMALEAIKELGGVVASGGGSGLRGQLMLFDGLWGETRSIAIKRRADCPVCGSGRGLRH
ncbi:MAG: molybdopterin biosynthesis protein [Paracoccus denitrificans]|nr:MAG: molybdopterin biosynthesis protein [Paracoccus denitrificans]PZO85014.1 MAG: molybdopterin biosynthesis protein [Paracoccus denitrificans]